MGDWKSGPNVRFGSKADMCAAKGHVRFTRNSDRESGHRQTVMSALPPKADMCSALGHVCFGPKADIGTLFDHLVGASKYCRRHSEAERFRGLEIDDELVLGRRLHRQITRLFALENAINISSRLPVLIDEVGPIGDQTPTGNEGALGIDCGQLV